LLPGEFLAGVVVGLIGGLTSGLLGVSPGGGLVVFAVLLLGAEQHAAQGISLVAQTPPTSISGVQRYREQGSSSSWKWLLPLVAGFLVGGVAGALAAAGASSAFLRWTYVAYLTALGVLMIARPPHGRSDPAGDGRTQPIPWSALVAVGAFAGFSSGFHGIGGGLAITAGLSSVLKVPQRQAQMISLVMSMIPTTIPAAWVYWREGWLAPWPVLVGVILGLVAGTDLGARLANRVSPVTLHWLVIGFVAVMALYMAYKAVG
jgi:uncharacterized membrane protein YfcA